MAFIYANAYCCIAALDGQDADYGLPGVSQNTPRSPAFVQQAIKLPNELQLALDPRFDCYNDINAISPPPLLTCGWTFQEGILSRRQLLFSDDTVTWACRSSWWFERVCGEAEDYPPADLSHGNYS